MMNPEQRRLYERIRTYPLNAPDAELPFATRLASEQGWTLGFASQVVEEYRKFVFLTQVAGEPLCPSREVDQAWHLHLTMTRMYWDDFCPRILGGRLHHTPSEGGPEERNKYWDRYVATLDHYRRLFYDQEPPPSVWPEPLLRFSDWNQHKRSELQRSEGNPMGWLVFWLVILGVVLLVARFDWCVAQLDAWLQLSGSAVFVLTLFGLLVAAIVGTVFRDLLRPKPDARVLAVVDLDLYEAAALAQGPKGAVDTALTQLVSTGSAQANPRYGTFTQGRPMEGTGSRLEEVLFQKLGEGSWTPAWLQNAMTPMLDEIQSRLRARGLLVPNFVATLSALIPSLALLAVGVLGFFSVLRSECQNREFMGFILIAVTVGLTFLFKPLHRTQLGDQVILNLQADPRPLGPSSASVMVALFGLEALAETHPAKQALEGGTEKNESACSGCG